jgi:hypothetical protein
MEDFRIQFKEKLESIFASVKGYPSQKVADMQSFLFEHTPKNLYRYRSFNENSISALLSDKIGASKPNTFNDPYDSYPGVNVSDIHVALREHLDSKVIEQYLPTEKLTEYVVSAYNDVILKGNNNYIACFSENINSILLWSHYADSHKGFVLEYDFTEMNGICKVDCGRRNQCDRFEMKYPLFPVIYQETRFNAINHILWDILYNLYKDNNISVDSFVPDNYIGIKPLLYKHNIWEYEKEWRLLIESSSSENFTCKDNIRAKSIYINEEKISKTNLYIIEKIADDKGIPLKKMKIDLFNLKYLMTEKK